MSAVTDLTYLSNFCAGNNEKMQKYIDIFLKSMPSVAEKITESLSKNDYIEIANQVHGCKTKFTMMGMSKAYELSQTIENQCRAGAIDDKLRTDISTIMQMITQSEAELKNHK
jgi:HPt (histidine-containing phosphotransfer) domain-containing protein